jgi:hypothetical protein
MTISAEVTITVHTKTVDERLELQCPCCAAAVSGRLVGALYTVGGHAGFRGAVALEPVPGGPEVSPHPVSVSAVSET